MDDWITTREAAALTGYSMQHVRLLVSTGAVRGQRFGDRWQVSRRSLLAYHKRAEQAGEKRGPKPTP
jgi:excisionase family DNA binding protein